MASVPRRPTLVDGLARQTERLRAERLATAVRVNGAQPMEWHTVGDPGEPAFEAGWSAATGRNRVAFAKDPQTGIVYLRGAVVSTSFVVGIFTLPVGYRPGAALLDLPAAIGSTAPNFVVIAGGRVTVNGTVSSGTLVSLEGISFSAEA